MTNKKTTKRALLASVIAILLCFAMLLGTTFAWFTDTVASGGNKIVSGTLDVDLYKVEFKPGWTLVDMLNGTELIETEITDSSEPIFGEDILWEPGYTAASSFKLVNNGSLALKYQVVIRPTAEVGKLAEVIDVYTRNAVVNANNGRESELEDMTRLGTLKEVMNGTTIIDGELEENGDLRYFSIVLKMQETAGNEYQGETAGAFDITVLATQLAYEEDSFGNDYDKDATYPENVVSTTAELEALVNNATEDITVNLATDLTGNVTLTQKADVDVVINGNGYKFNGVMTVFGDARKTGAEKLTITSINFVAANGANSCIVSPSRNVFNKFSYSHNVTVVNCTFTDPDRAVDCAAIRTSNGGDMNWTVENCSVDSTMHSIVQVANVEGSLKITNCTIDSEEGINVNQSANVSITGCTANVKGYAVRFGASEGSTVASEEYTIENCTLKSANNEGDAVIILRGTAADATLTITNTTIEGTPDIANNTNATVNR